MFAHLPNRVAAAFLIEELFPRLAADNDDVRLVLAGSQPTAAMLKAAAMESRIIVTGAVPDMQPHLQAASTMVVPLFQGSATRLKILEAFAARLPVVSTTKGAEGLAVENQQHLLIAEDVDEFVAAARRLWSDRQLAARLTANGLILVKEQYSWEVAEREIRSALDKLPMAAELTSSTTLGNQHV